ncbi:hypothetical protein MHM98_02480 [Psychrobium sp. MM17-31]|uniref:hypothetical protein n=1 Tax=Psychrobium sp. MM17-31 TaxID=2917758 RepID=UPI001EF4556C|nr:hypothetical protein [Psychrobium sp. MM17-31]MCG7530222.1 hypothetical protein [Psychrobium sp. MM17-31]
MRTIIATDIFGRNQFLLQFIQDCQLPADTLIVDPYLGIEHQFASQEQAYQCFIDNGGLDAYIASLSQILVNQTEPCRLIGFSAGASAIWRVLANDSSAAHVEKALCFYPGRIRHYQGLVPLKPLTIVFPAKEAHFDLAPVIEKVSNKEMVSARQLPLAHGFMNRQLSVFDEAAYWHYVKEISVGEVSVEKI